MIVFPMAGLSSRFLRAGYNQPKWKLPIDGRPLLDWALMSFESRFATETFVIAYLEGGDTQAFIRDRATAIGIRDMVFAPLAAPTRGQAETVHVALQAAKADVGEPLIIFNIDTMRPRCDVPTDVGWDGWVECFNAEGDGWSFVLPDLYKPNVAREVVEKRRVSDLCSTGVYYFRSRQLFEWAYAAELAQPSASELFVAPLYQHLIRTGARVGYDLIDKDLVINSGTPAEYEAISEFSGYVSTAYGRTL